MNVLALSTDNKKAINTVYNVAYGERTDLNELVSLLIKYLSNFDAEIAEVEVQHGATRQGDVPHSLASIDKAKDLLGYAPLFSLKHGLKEAIQWYWENLK